MVTPYYRYRLLEMIPGGLIWLTLLTVVTVTLINPVVMIYVVIIFDFYWTAKVIYLSTYLVISFRHYRQTMATNWIKQCSKLVRYHAIYHVVFIPNASENRTVVETTFAALQRSSFPKERMIVVYAAEERYPASIANGQAMQQRYGADYRNFIVVTHPEGLANEIPSKGANLAWAGKYVRSNVIDPAGIPYENIIVSVFDVDTCVPEQYFHYLTYTYITHPHPTRSSYQPIPMFHNNIWDAPAIMRVAATGTTFWLMAEQVRPERLLTFSSHSMPWQALVDVGWWQTDIVSDDSRIFLQCFLEYDGNYEVTPLHMPVYMDTVRSDKWWKSLTNLFKQQERWAWGSENIPYMIWHFWKAQRIPLGKRCWQIFNQMEGMWSWGTASLLIFFLGYVPLVLVQTGTTLPVIAANAPQLLQRLLTIANVGLILSVVLGTLILPRRPEHHHSTKYLVMLLQWLLLPISTICFGALPAISAQTRLFLGKYMGFYVTDKARLQR